MPMSTQKANALGKHFYNNDDMPNIGDLAGLLGALVPGVYWIALHTADPGAAGNQSTNEVTYTGNGRVSVVRTTSGFTIVGANVSNAGVVTFGQNTGATTDVATHFSIGTDETGSGQLEDRGLVTSPVSGLSIGPNITPSFAIGELDVDLV